MLKYVYYNNGHKHSVRKINNKIKIAEKVQNDVCFRYI